MAESVPERLRAAMNEARNRRDQGRTVLLSTILADLKTRELELQHPASDEEASEVVRRGIKRRREAAEQYLAARRSDLADRELAEAAALETFLPPAVDAAEIRAAVRAAIGGRGKDLGALMKPVLPRLQGRADGKIGNQIARAEVAPSLSAT